MNKNGTIWLKVNADSAVKEFWHAFGPIIHRLQTEPHNFEVCREAKYVLTVWYATDCKVVYRATIPIVDNNRFRSYPANLFKRFYEHTRYGATLTVWTRKLGSGEVWRQVTQSS